jgi:NAD(P)-dependent dehydrogenase (short-subunit alcohol dehydrogenase family)
VTNGFNFNLSGRTALVTGASSGLGVRFATILAQAGARVVLAARRTDLLEQICDTLRAQGHSAAAVAMDVTDEESTIAAYDHVAKTFGPVDTVIANAGMNFEGPVTELAVDEWDQVMAVNVRGAFLTAREAGRRMIADGARERGHGRIVLISSITAQSISPGLALYSASKAAVLQMGRVMARDWARAGINVNILCPGYISTNLNSEWFETEGGRKQIAKWPRRRLMEEADLDATLLYLASDAARAVTGSVFTIDDGQTL